MTEPQKAALNFIKAVNDQADVQEKGRAAWHRNGLPALNAYMQNMIAEIESLDITFFSSGNISIQADDDHIFSINVMRVSSQGAWLDIAISIDEKNMTLYDLPNWSDEDRLRDVFWEWCYAHSQNENSILVDMADNRSYELFMKARKAQTGLDPEGSSPRI